MPHSAAEGKVELRHTQLAADNPAGITPAVTPECCGQGKSEWGLRSLLG